MIGYRIRYADYGYDCWGKTEFSGYVDYDGIVYLKYDTAKKVMQDAERQFPDREFSIYKIDVRE